MKRKTVEEKDEARALAPEKPMHPLILKYRPNSLDEVVGQDGAVRSLKGVIEKGTSQAYLFTGPPGVGKTTMARIAARMLGCADADLLEIDAATYTGIDDMREVTSGLMYKPLGEGSIKAVIVDEAHALSKAAGQALLKIVEDPPKWVVWLFCTTEPTRMPKALATRCTSYDLKPVNSDILLDWLDSIAVKEKIEIGHGGEDLPDVVGLCVDAAEGSPRQALSNLALVSAARSFDEAGKLLRTSVNTTEMIELARALWKGTDWKGLLPLLNGLKDADPESVRHVVRAYMTKVALGKGGTGDARNAMAILDAFATPFNAKDGITPVVLACGRLVLSD